jgi:hypothetical protein
MGWEDARWQQACIQWIVDANPPRKPPKPIHLLDLAQTFQLQEEHHVEKLVHLLC